MICWRMASRRLHGLDAGVELNGIELSVLAVNAVDGLRAAQILNAGHEDVALVVVSAQPLYSFFRNRPVHALGIELDHTLKCYWCEVAFFLCEFERVFENDVAVQRAAVLAKWRRGELQDSFFTEALLEGAPCRRLGVMGLINEQVRTMHRHPLLHHLLTLACNLAGGHDDLRAREDAVHLARVRRNVLEHAHDGSLRTLFQHRAPWDFQHSECEKFFCKLGAQRVGRNDNEQFRAWHGDEDRQHGLRFAGAGRHHNRRR